jgi:response regulator RpfG family c-di-GMP phosphodiesterase
MPPDRRIKLVRSGQMNSGIEKDVALSRATILVVDDDVPLLNTMARDLRRMHFQPVPASDPSIALAMLEVRRFDAVLADLNLPLPSGGVFASEAINTAPGTPLIVITGEDSMRKIREMLAGAWIATVVSKPYNYDELCEVIEQALTHRRVDDGKIESETRLIADGLVRALALRDIETENHSRRVSAWTRILGAAIGLTGNELLNCELGALLHDVGKIGVPDAILRKPGKLDEAEWEEMRKHPGYGLEMLAGITQLSEASAVVYSHHERWDGKGYPQGLEGRDVPIGARIFAIVDTYDAMTSDRVYRKALPHEAALEEIKRLAGEQYDPDLVALFLSLDQDQWKDVRVKFEDPPLEIRAA